MTNLQCDRCFVFYASRSFFFASLSRSHGFFVVPKKKIFRWRCFLFHFTFALCFSWHWMFYLPSVESMNIIVCNFCLLCARNYFHSEFFFLATATFFRHYKRHFFHNFGGGWWDGWRQQHTIFCVSENTKPKTFSYEFYHFVYFTLTTVLKIFFRRLPKIGVQWSGALWISEF